jgi:hypothetical protein
MNMACALEEKLRRKEEDRWEDHYCREDQE